MSPRKFPLRFTRVGFGRSGVFHLWQASGGLGAHGGGSANGRHFLFRRLSRAHVAALHRLSGWRLSAAQAGLLTARYEGTSYNFHKSGA